ncbi:hypothetical protein UY3_01619 [Chelonia mydas]|uniref:Uncharacterized protein n=1 Tax=Chelonia mydas TaxID=8469 RepID=M7CJE6_CHEMY|nr:hypothetical protein UY3_01619 [Chelonia mydas]
MQLWLDEQLEQLTLRQMASASSCFRDSVVTEGHQAKGLFVTQGTVRPNQRGRGKAKDDQTHLFLVELLVFLFRRLNKDEEEETCASLFILDRIVCHLPREHLEERREALDSLVHLARLFLVELLVFLFRRLDEEEENCASIFILDRIVQSNWCRSSPRATLPQELLAQLLILNPALVAANSDGQKGYTSIRCHLAHSDKQPDDKSFLYKCWGTVLMFFPAESIKPHLRLLVEMVDFREEEEREVQWIGKIFLIPMSMAMTLRS